MLLLVLLTLNLATETEAYNGCPAPTKYVERINERATAVQTTRIAIDRGLEIHVAYACMSKCNENSACVATNLFTNDTCELVLSVPQLINVDEETTLYIKSGFECPLGFGYRFQEGTLTQTGQVLPSCYRFLREAGKWNDSRHLCRSLGGDLISIESEMEQMHIQNVYGNDSDLRPPGYAGYWTSGTDIDEDRRWVWEATGAPFTYKNFGPGQGGTASQHYLCIFYRWLGTWADFAGTVELRGLCETKATM